MRWAREAPDSASDASAAEAGTGAVEEPGSAGGAQDPNPVAGAGGTARQQAWARERRGSGSGRGGGGAGDGARRWAALQRRKQHVTTHRCIEFAGHGEPRRILLLRSEGEDGFLDGDPQE